MKKLSIVTINLNMKDGLKNSIKSLIAQNQKENVEYIVVDGLSSDGSVDIIEQYKEHIDVIKIEKDTGIFDAMNKGIDLATGEYIYFLNSGDEFASEDVLKTIIQEIDNTQNSHTIISGDVATFRFGKYIGIANLYPWIVHQSAFVKTSLMKDYKFDSNLKIFGDLDFWRRLYEDKIFQYHKIDKVIANMEIDGIGSNPRFIFKRLKDKKYYATKHKDYSNLLAGYCIGILGFISFKLFGETFYYHTFSKIMQNIKKVIRKPFWAIRRGGYKLYSMISYPFYITACKKYKFGSFIHPFASIGNHNLLSIGKNVDINHNVTIWGNNISIGDNSQVNPNTALYGNIKIGNDVMIAPNCMIAGGNHNFSDTITPIRFQGDSSEGIVIEDDVWIGANSVILDGVMIKKGSVIGAGSIVSKSIEEEFSIAMGNPCKVVRRRI
jgi:acetyltransferase-like isoleucine patch superfamily enzyme